MYKNIRHNLCVGLKEKLFLIRGGQKYRSFTCHQRKYIIKLVARLTYDIRQHVIPELRFVRSQGPKANQLQRLYKSS